MFNKAVVDETVSDLNTLNPIERYAIACRLLASSVQELHESGRIDSGIVHLECDMGDGVPVAGLIGVGVDAPTVRAVTEHIAARNPFVNRRDLSVDRPSLSQRIVNAFNRR